MLCAFTFANLPGAMASSETARATAELPLFGKKGGLFKTDSKRKSSVARCKRIKKENNSYARKKLFAKKKKPLNPDKENSLAGLFPFSR